MTSTKTKARDVIVVPRGTALADLLETGPYGIRELEEITAERGQRISRSSLSEHKNDPTRGISKARAALIADIYGVPVGDLFVHKDGAPLAAE